MGSSWQGILFPLSGGSSFCYDGVMKPPLSERLRPKNCDQIVGQDQLCGEGGALREFVEQGIPLSFLLWGPPGCGKTSLVEIYLGRLSLPLFRCTGSTFNLKEVKGFCETAQQMYGFNGKSSVVFVDEIHRLNKAQQDVFLPYVEKGAVILLGATTENPSFEVNKALLSRVKLFVLKALDGEARRRVLDRAEELLREEEGKELTSEAKDFLEKAYGSDIRSALNALDMALKAGKEKTITPQELERLMSEGVPFYDRDGESHYDTISALHKSVRNSDVDASLYWLARMVVAGEDRRFILRRMIRMASEDSGLADPKALESTLHAFQAFDIVGVPEGDIFLFYGVLYLALAPKSNTLYLAEGKAKSLAAKTSHLPVPMTIRNAPTTLMKDLGYGKGYRYAHDFEEKTTTLETLPPELLGTKFYLPNDLGNEKEIQKRYLYWEALKKKLAKEES